jgi:hypothetical protein
MYNGSIIISDPTKINKSRRRKIYIIMIIDKLKGRIDKLPI